MSLFSLFVLNEPRKTSENVRVKSVYAALPENPKSIWGVATVADARIEIISNYLKENNSPLAPYAADIIAAADKYDVDYRLTTAIAQKESGLCRVIPEGSYNCWGWGIHSKGTLTFSSYKEGIYEVTRGIRENYLNLGYTTPEEIMKKWVPHSPNGIWAVGVSAYMEAINPF